LVAGPPVNTDSQRVAAAREDDGARAVGCTVKDGPACDRPGGRYGEAVATLETCATRGIRRSAGSARQHAAVFKPNVRAKNIETDAAEAALSGI
jgi:hypothetical protein